MLRQANGRHTSVSMSDSRTHRDAVREDSYAGNARLHAPTARQRSTQTQCWKLGRRRQRSEETMEARMERDVAGGSIRNTADLAMLSSRGVPCRKSWIGLMPYAVGIRNRRSRAVPQHTDARFNSSDAMQPRGKCIVVTLPATGAARCSSS